MGAPTLLETTAAWGAAVGALPSEVSHHARRAVLDWTAATIAGAHLRPASLLRELVRAEGASGHAALVARPDRSGVRSAALVNATAAHTAEVDDIFRDGVYHPGAPTIAAALAAGQQHGRSGDDLLRAVTVGFEISTRVAAAVQPSHYRYWHTTGTLGTLGAAAAVASILELDAGRFSHALATSLTLASGLQQAFRSDAMSKPLHAGHAAEAGALAALSASVGFTGALDVLEGDAGFGAAMSDGLDVEEVVGELGSRWNITAMTFKNHACCGHTFAAVDAALALRARHGLEPERVRRVAVETYGTARTVTGDPDPTTEFEAKFSMPYCVAVGLTTGSVRLRAFDEELLRDPDVRALMGRVEIAVDPALDAAFPRQRAARVRIDLDDGSQVEELALTRKGDPDAPLTDDELQAKFDELVEPTLGPMATAALASALWALGGTTMVADLPLGSER